MERTMSANLRSYSAAAMIGVSARLLGEHRALLESLPRSASLIGDLSRAHDHLVEAQPVVASEADIEEIMKAQRVADGRHDQLARGVSVAMQAWEALSDEESARAEVEALRLRLLPEGLRVVRASYLETSGHAELLEGRLSEDDWEQLGTLRIAGATLATHVKRWIAAAKHLGELTARRAEAERTRDAAASPGAGEALEARFQWIRTIRALLAMIDLDDPDGEQTRVIHTVIQSGNTRAPRSASPETPTTGDAPQA